MRKKIRIMCLALILILNLTMVNAYASSTYDRDAIKSVQSILNMWGYDCGTPDGVQGKNTFLGVLPNNNMTGMAWISSDATVDTATALIELYSLVYAFDINVESPVKVQDLVGNILDEVSYDDEGIHFSNKSVKGSGLDIWMKYADLAE